MKKGEARFPPNYVTLKQLQEKRLKEKQEAAAAAAAEAAAAAAEAAEDERRRKLEEEEEERQKNRQKLEDDAKLRRSREPLRSQKHPKPRGSNAAAVPADHLAGGEYGGPSAVRGEREGNDVISATGRGDLGESKLNIKKKEKKKKKSKKKNNGGSVEREAKEVLHSGSGDGFSKIASESSEEIPVGGTWRVRSRLNRPAARGSTGEPRRPAEMVGQVGRGGSRLKGGNRLASRLLDGKPDRAVEIVGGLGDPMVGSGDGVLEGEPNKPVEIVGQLGQRGSRLKGGYRSAARALDSEPDGIVKVVGGVGGEGDECVESVVVGAGRGSRPMVRMGVGRFPRAGGYGGRQRGGRCGPAASGGQMVWVKKTT